LHVILQRRVDSRPPQPQGLFVREGHMAVRKNPDWSVWLADVWHWATRPPGIYVCIIIFLACGLLYALPPPSRHLAALEVDLQALRRMVREPAVPLIPCCESTTPSVGISPPATNTQYCDAGQIYDERTSHCLEVRLRTRNNCDDDWIFVDRFNGCISANIPTGGFAISGNDFFYIAGVRRTEIKVLSGSIIVTLVGSNGSPERYDEGSDVGFIGRWQISAGLSPARIKIIYQ
jgi:hypothetical protein